MPNMLTGMLIISLEGDGLKLSPLSVPILNGLIAMLTMSSEGLGKSMG